MTGKTRAPRRCCYTCRQCRAEVRPPVCEHPEAAGRVIRIQPGKQIPDWCPERVKDMIRRGQL